MKFGKEFFISAAVGAVVIIVAAYAWVKFGKKEPVAPVGAPAPATTTPAAK